jgi:hypothetical protein
MQAPHEPKHTLPEPMQQCNTGMQQRAKNYSLCPGRLDRLQQAVRPPHVIGPAPNCSKFARTNWDNFQMLPGAKNIHKLLPLVDIAWIKAKCDVLAPKVN